MEKMKKITKKELDEILRLNKLWLDRVPGGKRADLSHVDLSNVDLSRANLSHANLSYAKLCYTNLHCANLSYANLSHAKLHHTNLNSADLTFADLCCTDLSNIDLSYMDLDSAKLSYADLSCANLRCSNLSHVNLSHANLTYTDLTGADLRYANLSDTDGLKSNIDFLNEYFEKTEEGYIAYKTFGETYTPPTKWTIEKGSVLNENVNFNRTEECGCGINVAPLHWVRMHYRHTIWKCLIRWEWLAGVCCPYNSDGKIRCERIELIEPIETERERKLIYI